MHVHRHLIAPLLASLLVLAGCTVDVDEASLLPSMTPPTPAASAEPPAGITRSETLLTLPGLGVVHAVRLDRANSDATVIYSGGSGHFSVTAELRLLRIAALSGADVITYDYPGRGGTTVPRTADALIAMGPALLDALRRANWIGSGPLYPYGFSFGGALATGIARSGGFAGLILESTSSDIEAMGNNMVPWPLRPLVNIAVDEDRRRFDYFSYVVAAHAPILLLASDEDAQADVETVRAFAERLSAARLDVTFRIVEGDHGDALRTQRGGEAITEFTTAARTTPAG